MDLFRSIETPDTNLPDLERLRSEGKTLVFVGTSKDIIGIIAIRDEIRPESQDVIIELKKMNVETLMLTGDNELTARAIANELGIENVRADLRPEEKVDAVLQLEREYEAVAMVGDGINDAPALAHATVGIAMGTGGTDAAIEAADVALVGDDLKSVYYSINLGKRARQISRQNIAFSLIVLALLIPAALIGILSPVIAVTFHEASELLAVGNGFRVAKN
jgi:Cd2+/Zn2+-exporting ATPase